MNQPNSSINIARLIAAIMVVIIHCCLFLDWSPYLNLALRDGACRLAVPFFFMCAGYYFNKNAVKKGYAQKYTLRIVMIFGSWSLFYFLCYNTKSLIAGQNDVFTESIPQFLRHLFIDGYERHIWYLIALIQGILVICLLRKWSILHCKTTAIAGLMLYLIGCGLDSYHFLWDTTPIYTALYNTSNLLFGSPFRNILWFGLPFLIWGTQLQQYLSPPPFVKKSEDYKLPQKALRISGIGLTLLITEIVILTATMGVQGGELYLSIPVVVLPLTYYLMSDPFQEQANRIPQAIRTNQLSLGIYLIHPFFIKTYENGISYFGFPSSSITLTLFTLLLSILSVWIIKRSVTNQAILSII